MAKEDIIQISKDDLVKLITVTLLPALAASGLPPDKESVEEVYLDVLENIENDLEKFIRDGYEDFDQLISDGADGDAIRAELADLGKEIVDCAIRLRNGEAGIYVDYEDTSGVGAAPEDENKIKEKI